MRPSRVTLGTRPCFFQVSADWLRTGPATRNRGRSDLKMSPIHWGCGSGGHPSSGCQPQKERQQDQRRRGPTVRCRIAVVRVADASHRGPGPARLRQAPLVWRVRRSTVAPDVLEVTVKVVLWEKLASMLAVMGEVLLPVKVGVRAVVCAVGLVPRWPAADEALDSLTCR